MLNPKPSTSPWRQHALRRSARETNRDHCPASESAPALPVVESAAAVPVSLGVPAAAAATPSAVVAPTTRPSSSSAGCRSGGPGGKAITPSQREPTPGQQEEHGRRVGASLVTEWFAGPGKTRRCERPEGAGRTQSQKRSCRVGFLLPCSTGEPAGVRPLGTPSLRRHGYRRAQANVAR